MALRSKIYEIFSPLLIPIFIIILLKEIRGFKHEKV